MTILFACGFILLFILVIAGSLKLQVWNSSVHMINVDWMDGAEKFKMIARWGA